jgi:hypothetical protein
MPMKRVPVKRILAIAVLLAVAVATQAQENKKKLYCWDDHGHKVCGDALPPEAAASARSEISASGLHTNEVARALTADERAAAAVAAREAELQAQTEAARQRRDMAMAESYATETDLRNAFQERIDLLDETLKASQLGVSGLRQSLLGLLRQAGELELAGKPVPQVTADNVARQHAELQRRADILAQQQRDRIELDDELNRVVARYRAMKAPASTAVPAEATAPAPQGNG